MAHAVDDRLNLLRLSQYTNSASHEYALHVEQIQQNIQGKKFSSLVWHGAVHILLFTVKACIPVYPVLLWQMR